MITVQLEENGPITEMDERLLWKRWGTDEDDDASATWVEYWTNWRTDQRRCVHRSAHVTIKKMPALFAEAGSF